MSKESLCRQKHVSKRQQLPVKYHGSNDQRAQIGPFRTSLPPSYPRGSLLSLVYLLKKKCRVSSCCARKVVVMTPFERSVLADMPHMAYHRHWSHSVHADPICTDYMLRIHLVISPNLRNPSQPLDRESRICSNAEYACCYLLQRGLPALASRMQNSAAPSGSPAN